jgi:hypothetical protein
MAIKWRVKQRLTSGRWRYACERGQENCGVNHRSPEQARLHCQELNAIQDAHRREVELVREENINV